MKLQIRIVRAKRPNIAGYGSAAFPLPYAPTPTTPFPSPCGAHLGCAGCAKRRHCRPRLGLGQSTADIKPPLPYSPKPVTITPPSYMQPEWLKNLIKTGADLTSFNTALIFGAPAVPGIPGAAPVTVATKWVDQEMISGVPNKFLVGGAAGLFLLASLRKGKRR
jgi:hypothetical protein